MFDTLQIWATGLAAVIDTALLVVLLERRNRPFARVPIVVLLIGAWLIHVGAFALLILGPTDGVHALQKLFVLAMATGILLKPSGMLHAALRVSQTGLDIRRQGNPWHALLYLPLLALIPLAFVIETSPTDGLIGPILPWATPYLVWASGANCFAAAVFLRVRSRMDLPGVRPFFVCAAVILIIQIALNVFIFAFARAAWPDWDRQLLAICGVPSMAMVILFAYFSIRFNFLRLVLERAVVYGSLLACLAIFHQFAFQEASLALPRFYRLALVVLEGTLLTLMIALYRPLRRRFAEAIRYLMGAGRDQVRERLRSMSIRLSGQAHRSVDEILQWFAAELRESLGVEFVAGWLMQPDGDIRTRFGDAGRVADIHAAELARHMTAGELLVCYPPYAIGDAALESLQSVGVSLAVLKTHPSIIGLLLVGKHARHRELDEEEVSAIVLLVEQLTVALENSRLLTQRRVAEQRMAQAEKLSALGLMASAIAHEVKNPLSAIKTIATVLGENLGPDSPHAEDVAMIRGEIDRLAVTTNELLDVARPARGDAARDSLVRVDRVVLSTAQILRRLALQKNVTIETNLDDDLPSVRADESSLREIFFNLVTNSLEAASEGGRISVRCTRINGHVVTEVRDDGPGIAEELRKRIFEPFVTTRTTGTGLGLYVVSQRVDELGGEVECESGPDGTSFTVKIPTS